MRFEVGWKAEHVANELIIARQSIGRQRTKTSVSPVRQPGTPQREEMAGFHQSIGNSGWRLGTTSNNVLHAQRKNLSSSHLAPPPPPPIAPGPPHSALRCQQGGCRVYSLLRAYVLEVSNLRNFSGRSRWSIQCLQWCKSNRRVATHLGLRVREKGKSIMMRKPPELGRGEKR